MKIFAKYLKILAEHGIRKKKCNVHTTVFVKKYNLLDTFISLHYKLKQKYIRMLNQSDAVIRKKIEC